MIRLLAVLVLAGASVNAQSYSEATFGHSFGTWYNDNWFVINFVGIGNPNNTGDTTAFKPAWRDLTGLNPPAVGSVGYSYFLGKFEISRDTIERFNRLSEGDSVSLENLERYGMENLPTRPATGISYYEAARFVNWLNTSQGYSRAYNLSPTGIAPWNPLEAGYQANNPIRNAFALFALPTLDEWHKGAYGSPTGTWYGFPTGSNTAPTPVSGGTTAGTAVYGNQANLANVDDAGGLSAWGTMAQGGNAWEWTETWVNSLGEPDPSGTLVAIRGGDWGSNANVPDDNFLASAHFNQVLPQTDSGIGFRVVMVPEPSSLSLLLAGGAVALARRRKS